MGKNREAFDNPADGLRWAGEMLNEAWGDEYQNLDRNLQFEVIYDLLESERTAEEIRNDVGKGNLESYAKTLAVQTGNPSGVPLHEALADLAQWTEYEANVVEQAADEIDDASIANAAEEQAESMHEAADMLDEAAEDAAETAAEVFVETGIPSDENTEPVVSGNPSIGDRIVVGEGWGVMYHDPQTFSRSDGDVEGIIYQIEGDNVYAKTETGRTFDTKIQGVVVRGNPGEIPVVSDVAESAESVVEDVTPEVIKEKVQEGAAEDMAPEPSDWLHRVRWRK